MKFSQKAASKMLVKLITGSGQMRIGLLPFAGLQER